MAPYEAFIQYRNNEFINNHKLEINNEQGKYMSKHRQS